MHTDARAEGSALKRTHTATGALRLLLRGGTADASLSHDEEGTCEVAEARTGLFPGKWDAWGDMQSATSCDFNVTDDIVYIPRPLALSRASARSLSLSLPLSLSLSLSHSLSLYMHIFVLVTHIN